MKISKWSLGISVLKSARPSLVCLLVLFWAASVLTPLAQPANTTTTYTAGANWVPITFDPTATVPGSALDFSGTLDAPAGRYGAVYVDSGTFHFTNAYDKPVRFYGAVIGGDITIMSHAASDKLAASLAAAGYNIVRFHSFDWWIVQAMNGVNAPSSLSTNLDATALDNFFYLVSALKAKGIYYTLDLYSSRYFDSSLAPGMSSFGPTFHREAAGLALIPTVAGQASSVLQNIETFSQNLLTTTNGYTGMALKNDPALVSIEFINEDPWWKTYNDYPTTTQTLIYSAYTASGTSLTLPQWLVVQQANIYSTLKSFLATKGVNKPFMDMSNRVVLASVLNRNAFDYVDIHDYWELTLNVSTDILQGRLETPFEPACNRIFGKPYATGEFNIPWPVPNRAFIAPVMAAYGGEQNWNSLIRCTYGYHAANVNGPNSSFGIDVSSDPAALLGERIGSMLFTQNEVAPSQVQVPVVVTPDFLNGQLTTTGGAGYHTRLLGLVAYCQMGTILFDPNNPISLKNYPCVIIPYGMTPPTNLSSYTNHIVTDDNSTWSNVASDVNAFYTGTSAAGVGLSSNTNNVTSSTGQIEATFNSASAAGNTLKVVTPRTETFLFSGAASTVTGNVMTAANLSTPGICFAGSLDELDLGQSRHILAMILTDTQNSNSVVTTDANDVATVTTAGGLPHLAQQATAQYSFASLPGRPLPQVWALDATGQRVMAVTPSVTSSGYTFPVQVATPSPFPNTNATTYCSYEIVWSGLPLFSQDFSGTTPPNSYVAASGISASQFNDLSAETDAGSWTTPGGVLQISRPGITSGNNGAGFTRFGGVSGPAVARYAFNFTVGGRIDTMTDLALLDAGSIHTITDYNTATANSNVGNRLSISGDGINLFRLNLNGTFVGNYASGTPLSVMWMLNQSGETKTYTGPDTLTHTLQNGCSDLWVSTDGTWTSSDLLLTNAARPTAFLANKLGGFRFRTPAPNNNNAAIYSLSFYNFSVFDTLDVTP